MGVVVGTEIPHVELVGLQRRIFEAVLRAGDTRISTDDLVGVIYSDRSDGGPNWANSTVRRLVFEINKKLRPLGFRIHGKVGRSSSGYIIVREVSEWDAMWSRPFDWPHILHG